MSRMRYRLSAGLFSGEQKTEVFVLRWRAMASRMPKWRPFAVGVEVCRYFGAPGSWDDMEAMQEVCVYFGLWRLVFVKSWELQSGKENANG